MSQRTSQMRQDAKEARWQELLERTRYDDKSGDEHRRAAAHAHVMTHHALEMDTPEAHEAAACAHDKVAEMHRDAAETLEGSEEQAAGPANKKSKTQGK